MSPSNDFFYVLSNRFGINPADQY